MKAIGLTCGIGSMLCGARQAGFDIEGNIEWRKYYHKRDEIGRNTFEENYPGAQFVESLDHMSNDEIERFFGADLALGHPECGNFSVMSSVSWARGNDKRNDPGDIPLFVDMVARLKPRFFVMDDLPGSLVPFPMVEYARRLPDYDLFPEWVSNWGYGNVQKRRNRFFMLGSLKDERWSFVPREVAHDLTTADIIGDLPDPTPRGNIPDHHPHTRTARSTLPIIDPETGERRMASWEEAIEYTKTRPVGENVPYPAADGTWKNKIGFGRGPWRGPSRVLMGSASATLHPLRCDPFTIRERARLQGFPDEFLFYGTILDEHGYWDHNRNAHMVKQTGKAMPVQFCRFVSDQVARHIRGEDPGEPTRVIKSNPQIDAAKQWYCENIGYSDQERACASCWLYSTCTIRSRKYRIGEPAVGQRDAFDPGVVPVKGEPSREAPRPQLRTKKGESKIRGQPLGVGRRMRELIDLGWSAHAVAEAIRSEFPGSTATETDVDKVRARYLQEGRDGV